jgi:hypothetical protein
MLYGEDLNVTDLGKPNEWKNLPVEMKAMVLSYLPLGTLMNAARFVSKDFNDIVVNYVFHGHFRVPQAGVVSGGLTEVEFSTLCQRAARTATTVTIVGDTVTPHPWTFQGVDRVLLAANWQNLTELVVEGKFRSWDGESLVRALRRGLLRKLERLELVQQNVLRCRSLFGWILPNIKTLAVNVAEGIQEFLNYPREDRPFDNMPNLVNFHLSSLDHHTLYVSGYYYPVSMLLEAVLPASAKYLRVHTYPSFFRFSSMHGVFGNVQTISVDPHALNSKRLSRDEPRLMLRVFPSVTKIYVKWDVSTKYSPKPLEGIGFMQAVYDSLGEGWEGETRVIDTGTHGRRATGVHFVKR